MKICGQNMPVAWQWKVNWEALGNSSGLESRLEEKAGYPLRFGVG